MFVAEGDPGRPRRSGASWGAHDLRNGILDRPRGPVGKGFPVTPDGSKPPRASTVVLEYARVPSDGRSWER